MTDARIPERWLSDRRVLRLSDRGFRLFVVSLTWSVANRSDGTIEADDIDMMPGNFSVTDIGELIEAGVMTKVTGKAWAIADYATTQSSRHELEVLENVRRREREKKARQRAKNTDDVGTVPGEQTGGTSPGTAQAGRTGRQEGAVEGPPPTESLRAVSS